MGDGPSDPAEVAVRPGQGAGDGAGLTDVEAAARLARDGPNVLPVVKPPPAWRLLLGQMVHFFAVMLWIAGVLAIVAGLPALGVAIFVVVVVNGAFAFTMEHRADQAAARLRDLLPQRVTVVRAGRHLNVDASQVVMGDLVLLEAGDRISADMHTLEAHALTVDTSTLTGESVPVPVEAGQALHAGTYVVEGEAAAEVVATGSGTRLAGVAALTRTARRPVSPLTHELRRVVRLIAMIALSIGAAFFLLSLLLDIPVRDAFLFAIGVTVALVPEGLLPTVTLSLAVGAQRMAARNALVRRLGSVETLGSTTFVCTDKTGTLTRNEMSVVRVWTPQGSARITGVGYEPEGSVDPDSDTAMPALSEAARIGARCSTGHAVEREGRWVAQGDPMEAALDVFARRVGVDPDEDRVRTPGVRRFPFDPRRRRMSIVAAGEVLVKGAPDAVIPLCRDSTGAAEVLGSMAGLGLRVLAVARRDAEVVAATSADAERDLELVGLIGMEDPPRPEVAESLAACRRAGIRVAMVTGDHPATAGTIAREVGLAVPGAPALVGADLPEDDAALADLIDCDGVVLSRVDPEDKLRIARALQGRGHVVAMTGDGVNDGPALQEADIGVAMGRSGTDVAREAADLVLLDDDFATIVAAVEQGRATFTNIRRFLTYHLTDNVAELTPFVVWALSGGAIPLALSVLQVLALDIGTDTLPAVALGVELPDRRALDHAPATGHILTRRMLFRVFGVLGPAEAIVEMLAFGAVLVAGGWALGTSPSENLLMSASGAAFTAVVFGQIVNAFACRSTTRWPGALGWTSNRFLVWAVLVELAITACFLFVPPLADLLGQSPTTPLGWSVALLAIPAVLGADALHKWLRVHRPRLGT
ncbi:MAG: cation-transporting P-type ATPase [Acidimicrobiia bacterium]|nr:cation-transporting P-type ATPase [Acidimicrobiia bacterium]